MRRVVADICKSVKAHLFRIFVIDTPATITDIRYQSNGDTQMQPQITHWEVTNRNTGKTTTYRTGAAASTACNRMDNAYGSKITVRRAVWAS